MLKRPFEGPKSRVETSQPECLNSCAAGLALAAAAPVALAPLGALPPRVRSVAMATDGDADVLRIFLRDEAHVHAKIIDRTLLQLEEQEVFNMEGVRPSRRT